MVVIDKLRDSLKAEFSEAQVVYVLALIRKILDQQRGVCPFSYLRFFCDWALHARVDRSGARRILHHLDDAFPTLIKNESRIADGCRFLVLFGFHLEFKWLLRSLALPEISNERWCEFLRSYLDVIAGVPAYSSDLGLRHLKELAIERVIHDSKVNYQWRLTLRNDEIRRLPLDPGTFFNVRPTTSGEPWLWKGPVAAMVGLPEGWVTDNEQNLGYQFCMYPALNTREYAMRKSVFLYGNIVPKSDREPTMEAIADRHEREILNNVPTAKFQRLAPLEKNNRAEGQFPRTLLRVGHILPSYGGPEYSLYIDSPKGVLVLVLLCPEGQDEKYLPALKWIGASVLMMTRQDDNDIPAQSPGQVSGEAST